LIFKFFIQLVNNSVPVAKPPILILACFFVNIPEGDLDNT